ncbi:MAG: UDP-N-acetylmuramoyl-L-alanyl-D-glutamate--2,6-diaminopimelate ligase, partial [Nitrospinae bacterium]|nr:UDP-N-acetylmuramoyl-L-alanyl-D-glutamate--2,6-diaminopimelate ligase [Nitrospinota bacterium]
MSPPPEKPLEELIAAMTTLTVRGSATGTAITGVCHDSREVRPGSAFVAVRGAAADGHDFIGAAIAKGAVAIVAERDPALFGVALPDRVTLAIVPDSRAALARLADYFYDSPSRELKVTGVTGTNGKTTTTYLVQAMM